MKKIQLISICALIVALAVMAVNRFIAPLPDWAIRIDGMVMLAALFAASFSTVKLYQGKP